MGGDNGREADDRLLKPPGTKAAGDGLRNLLWNLVNYAEMGECRDKVRGRTLAISDLHNSGMRKGARLEGTMF